MQNYTLREQQLQAIDWVKSVSKRNIKHICIEASTGSGKSIVAKELTNIFGSSYVLMPYIALQQQYVSDFDDCSPLLGRGRFPCLKANYSAALNSIPIVRKGDIPKRPEETESCAAAPCLGKPRSKAEKIKKSCEQPGCPHQISIDVAQNSKMIVGNFYSYIYNVYLGSKLEHRKVMILDECHMAADTIRSFLTTKFLVRREVLDLEINHLKTTEQWLQWLSLSEQMSLLTNEEAKDSYLQRMEKLKSMGQSVHKSWRDENKRLWIEFIPCYVGSAFRKMITDYADIVVYMSGSILKLELFMQELGIKPEESAFLRLPSTFPVENRKVFLPARKDIDLSFKNAEKDFWKAIDECRRIMSKYPDVKGIIQCSSYRMMRQLEEGLKSPRLVTHESEDFTDKLAEFKQSDLPLVFASCRIVEGCDFKDEYARFQIIMTPQYAPASEPYTKWLLENGRWDLYRWKSSQIWCQQLGRPVRSDSNWGFTHLIDSRFYEFLKKTWSFYPKWLTDAIQKET